MITQAYLKSRLEYDPLTGVFTWKQKPGSDRMTNTWNTRYAGKIAGTVRRVDNSDLYYLHINLFNRPRRAHRLAWLYTHGEFPKLIDHIDGDGLNNKLENLRPLSMSLNIRKGKIASNNSSGMKGVSYRSDTEKWTARLKVGDKYKSLGSFSTKDLAFEAYCAKVLEITGELHINLISKESI